MTDGLVGRTIEGYRVDAEIGRGGQAVVYRATQLSLQRPVALKVVTGQGSGDPGFMERFRREGIGAAALDHPNVVPVYEAGEHDGLAFLAMKLVDGPTLDGLVRAEGPLPHRRAMGILRQVASALDYAAGRGLVHRDVKPGNILVGPGDHAYLGDFGLMKALEGGGEGLTRTGTWMGTLEYIAPEQVSGGRVTPAADRYALAVIAYELATGRSPFPREERTAVLYAHVHDTPPAPSSVRPELGPRVDAALLRGLAKDPEARHPTAVALVDELAAALEAEAPALLPPRSAAVAPTVPPAAAGPAPTPMAPAPPTVTAETAAPTVAGTTAVTAGGRRRPRMAVVLPVAGLLVAGAVGGVVIATSGGDGGDGTVHTVTIQPTTTTTTGTVGASGFPDASETSLLAHVPEAARASCSRTPGSARAAGAEVSVRCEFAGQGIYYESFPTVSGLRTYYAGVLDFHDLARASGRCPGSADGEDAYGQGGADLGRVACYALDDGSPAVVWTHEPLRIVATMIGGGDDTPARLLAVWRDAGPYE